MATVIAVGASPAAYARFEANFESVLAQNGTTVLWMRNSNPAFNAPNGTPGRWLVCPCFIVEGPT